MTADPEQNAPTAEHAVGDCAVYEHGRRRPGRVPLDQAGEAAAAADGYVWIGLQQPTAAEVQSVAAEFGLPALAVEDAVKAHQRPKLEVYDDVVFVVLKPVGYVDSEEVIKVSDIAVFLGRNFVVTVRHGSSCVLRDVRRRLDGGHELASSGPMTVLHQAADHVVDEYERAIASIDDDVAEIEAQVFSTDPGDHAERIYKLKREVLEFRRAVAPLAAPLERLAAGTVPGVPGDLRQHFRDVHDHLLRAADARTASAYSPRSSSRHSYSPPTRPDRPYRNESTEVRAVPLTSHSLQVSEALVALLLRPVRSSRGMLPEGRSRLTGKAYDAFTETVHRARNADVFWVAVLVHRHTGMPASRRGRTYADAGPDGWELRLVPRRLSHTRRTVIRIPQHGSSRWTFAHEATRRSSKMYLTWSHTLTGFMVVHNRSYVQRNSTGVRGRVDVHPCRRGNGELVAGS